MIQTVLPAPSTRTVCWLISTNGPPTQPALARISGPDAEPTEQALPGLPESLSIIAIGSSAGGVAALPVLLSALPADFQAPVIVVQHLAPQSISVLSEILRRRISLSVRQIAGGERLIPSYVYVAPPNRHVLVAGDGTLDLSESARVHFVRPSADVLFKSLAEAFKSRVIAVILTGSGLDGAEGAQAVSAAGGIVIAQDEATSDHFGMPSAAIRTGSVHFILPLRQIAPLLISLIESGIGT